jgi:hypothetical protein
MKRLLPFIILLFSVEWANAQVYTGINGSLSFPQKGYTEVDYGIGGDLVIGCVLDRKFDFSISIANSWFSSKIPGFSIGSMNMNFRYYFLQKSIKPYIGVGSGYYRKKIESPLDGSFLENGIGLDPHVGILFETGWIKGMYTDVELSYKKIFTAHQVRLFNIGIGILYCLDRKSIQ